jgi:mono/diheme cytochrome c family protein
MPMRGRVPFACRTTLTDINAFCVAVRYANPRAEFESEKMVGNPIGRAFVLSTLATVLLGRSPIQAADHLAAARKEFQVLCSPCHGMSARGNGPAAPSLKTPPADLTQISKRYGGAFPKARVFDTILGVDRPLAHGSQEMPIWGDIFIDEAVGGSLEIGDAQRDADEVGRRVNALVAYLESIQEPK